MDSIQKNFEIYELFVYFVDITSESQIEKVLVNERKIFEFFDSFSLYRKVMSFYGDDFEIEKYFETKLRIKVTLRNDNHPAVFYGIIFDDTIYLILACQSTKFFIQKPLKKESLLIIMKKYLQDISENIVIMPNEEILKNWSLEKISPFEEESSLIRKIEISEKVQEKLIINDFPILYENINDILHTMNLFSFQNNHSQNIYLYKIYNNRENQENSACIFFNYIKRNLIKYSKIKENELMEQANKYGLNFSHTDLSFISDQIGEFNQKCLCVFHDLKHKIYCFFYDLLHSICKGKVWGWNFIDLDLNREKIEDICFLIYKKEFENIFIFEIDRNEINFKDNEFNRFLESYCEKVTLISKDKNFFSIFLKSLKGEFLNIKDLFLEIKSKLYNNLNTTVTKLDNFQIDYINKNSFNDCLEINKIIVNPLRNDLTGTISLNMIQIANKFKFDEMSLNEKIFKGKKIKRIFSHLEIKNIFPTSNPNNYIIVFLQHDDTSDYYHFCFCFSQNLKKLFTLNLKSSKKYYINYFPQIETLSLFDTQCNIIHQFKISKDGIKEDLNILNVKFEKISEIDDFVYLEQIQKYIFLNEGTLYEISISKNNSTNLQKCVSQKIIDGNSISHQIRDSKTKDMYKKIIYSGSGDFFGLQNSLRLDFYDVNYLFHHDKSINVENSYIKLFTDKKDSYLVIYNNIKKIFTAKILEGCGSNFNILEEERKKIDIKGNPIMDYIASGFIKYGSKTEILQNFDEKINYYFYLPQESSYDILLKHVKDYSSNLFKSNSEVNFKILRNINAELDELLSNIDFDEDKIKVMKRILISRVPIQICSIENDNIIPLNDGKRILISENFTKMKKIEEKAKYLSFGYIEKLLKDIKEDLFLVCIIGRQSSGKSYLLNRIFGTRFAVAATRCTDGIWLSYSFVDNCHFIVFDCEGLFSRQRKEIEEIKLLTLLAALSDFTYLNQDLTFNRHLNDLLNNLDKSVDRLRGEKLFKGKLIWTVRDVANSEKDGAYNEFKGHLNSFQKSGMSFINKLFGGKIDFVSLNNYENSSFTKEIGLLRKEAVNNKIDNIKNNSIHWKNGEEFLKFLKINLVQLYTDDDSNADEIADQFYLNDFNEKLLEIWETFSTEKSYEFQFTYVSDSEKITSKFYLDKMPFRQINDDNTTLDNILKEFKERFQDYLRDKNMILIHYNFYENFDNFLNVFKQFRLDSINSIIEKEINMRFTNEKASKYLQEIKNQFSNKMTSLNICKNKCSKCFMICSLLKNHKSIQEELYNKKTIELEKLVFSENDIKAISFLEAKKRRNDELKNEYEINKRSFDNVSEWFQKKIQLDENHSILENLGSKILINKEEIKELQKIEQFQNFISDNLCYEDKFKCLNKIFDDMKENFYDFEWKNNFLNDKNIKIILADTKIVFENAIELNLRNKEKLTSLIDDLDIKTIEEEDKIKEIEKKKYDINDITKELNNIRNEKSNTECLFTNEEEKLDIVNKNRVKLLLKLEEKEKETDIKLKEIESISKNSEILRKIFENSDNINNLIVYFLNYKRFNNEILFYNDKIQYYSQENFNNNIRIKEIKDQLLENLTCKIKNEISENESKLVVASKLAKKQLEEKRNKLQNELNDVLQEVEKNFESNKELREYLNIVEKNKDEIQKLSEKKSKINSDLNNLENYVLIINKFIDNNTSEELDKFISKLLHSQIIKDKLKIGDYEYFENFNINDSSLLTESLIDEFSSLKNKIDVIFSGKSVDDYEICSKKELGDLQINILSLNKEIEGLDNNINNLNEIKKKLENDFEGIENKESYLVIVLENKSNEIDNMTNSLNKIKEIKKLLESDIYLYKNKQNLFYEFENIITDVNDKMEKLSTYFTELEYAKEKYLKLIEENKEYCETISFKEKEIKRLDLEFEKSGKIKGDYNNKKHEDFNKSLEILSYDIKNNDLEIDTLTEKSQNLLKKKKLEIEIDKIKENLQNSCDCQTNHKCSFFCKICPKKECVNLAGHDSSHFCEIKNHRCNSVCEIKNCNKNCELDADHQGDHKCNTDHKCKEICKACSNQCKYLLNVDHEEHICSSEVCPKKCIVCKKKCSSKDHMHDLRTEEITFKGVKTRLHLCEEKHECYEKCNYLGTCGIKYEEIIKNFESSFGENFSYSYFQPEIFFKKCEIKIEIGNYKHNGPHKCDKALINEHRCDFQCPDCKSICKENYKHVSNHNFVHRNKENCYFTNESGENIIIEDEKGLRKYKVKEKAIAEDCYSSCKRRGRGHIHLIKCEGNTKSTCLQKKLSNVKHSKIKYCGFESNQYDELNCKDFWNYYNINNPIGTQADEHSKCNFICCLCETDDVRVFCSEIVLHSDNSDRKEHFFDCGCEEKKIYRGIDICFCIDITGSMSSYITTSIQTIKNIISKTKNKIENELKSSIDSLRISVVGYRDHCDENILETLNFSNHIEAERFLENLTASGGGDAPEAVADGLDKAFNMSWSGSANEKIMFLILDAPPHGTRYHDFGEQGDNYPSGCNCGKDIDIILKEFFKKNIKIYVLKIGSSLNKMENEFRKTNEYIRFIPIEGTDSTSLVCFQNEITNIVCRALKDKECTVRDESE